MIRDPGGDHVHDVEPVPVDLTGLEDLAERPGQTLPSERAHP